MLRCEECFKHVYQFPECEPITFDIGDGVVQTKKRKPDDPPPCSSCPKGHPDNDNDCRLSWQNTKLLDLYYRLQCPGYKVPWHLEGDPLFADLYSRVEEILREVENDRMASRMAYDIAIALIRR